MVLILSNILESSTYKIIDWLKYKCKNYICVNNSVLEIESVTPNDFCIWCDGVFIDGALITSFWHNRGVFKIIMGAYTIENYDVLDFYKNEISILCDYLYVLLYKKNGTHTNFTVNKIDVLNEATICGLDVPKTIITTKKKNIELFFGKDTVLLTKTFKHPNNNIKSEVGVYTSLIDISILDEKFAPSFVQEYVPKEFEIRTFFLRDHLYSMAVFTQRSQLTKIDGRRSTAVKNRHVPYKLPLFIESKILTLLSKLNLLTGTIDIIKSTDGKYYFLEVTPMGVFSDVSHYCNYYLEKEVADFLH